MKIIRRGISRTVILIGKYAIKVPSLRTHGDGIRGSIWSFARGVVANHSEITWYQYDVKNLCPILWHGLFGLVIVMPRCEQYIVDDKTEEKMYTGDFCPVDFDILITDNKPENYGILNGNVVMVDYDMSFNACIHDKSGYRNRQETEESRYERQMGRSEN